METTEAFLTDLRSRQSSARRALSIPLFIHALALGILAWSQLSEPPFWGAAFVPLLTYTTIFVAARAHRSMTGVGAGNERVALLALIFLSLLFLPFGLLVHTYFVGPVTLLGAGLLYLGARSRQRSLWGPALVLLVVGPLVANYTIDNHVDFVAHPSAALLGLITVGFAALTLKAYRRERAIPHGDHD